VDGSNALLRNIWFMDIWCDSSKVHTPTIFPHRKKCSIWTNFQVCL
jgi:hypothetical protein